MTRKATCASGSRTSIRRITTAQARLPILLDLLLEDAVGKAGAARVDVADVALAGAVRMDKAAVLVGKAAVRMHWPTRPRCRLGRPNSSRSTRCVSKWLN